MTGRSFDAPSRRDVFRTGAAFAAAVPLFPAVDAARGAPLDAGAVEQVARANADPNRRVLLKGGTVVSLDRQVGDLARGMC